MFDNTIKQPYITAVYDKVDSIRFEVFLRSFTAITQAMIASPLILANHAEDLMQAALDKMEGLEIIQRVTTNPNSVWRCEECGGTVPTAISHDSGCSHWKPLR